MPGYNNEPTERKLPAIEFLVGQHSLFFAAIGLASFYLHLFKPYLRVWVAGPFFLISWAAVFMLFFANRPLFSPRKTRHYWLFAAGWYALFTVMAELLWILGDVPPLSPSAPVNPAISIIVLQVLMNIGWLSFIPIIHDYLRNPHLWK